MSKKKTSPSDHTPSQQKLDEVWPKLGPFPWLRTLEVVLEDTPTLTADVKTKTAEIFRFIRIELRERSATTEAEQAFLRILRAIKVDDQKQMLQLFCEEGFGMPTDTADAFVDNLNFEALGTGASRA